MRILGIETSCDETAVCLIEAEGEFGPGFKYEILGNALRSQAKLHAEYGGVFPNLAKREHGKGLVPMLELALHGLTTASTSTAAQGVKALPKILEREPELLEQLVPFLERSGKPDIDAIAVTYGPGLEPALWVGVNFARALSLAWHVPIVAVNHLEGHIVMSMTDMQPRQHSNVLQNVRMSGGLADFEFPILALLISGGNTQLVLSKEPLRYEVVGRTRDDAAGEAFDKVARMMHLPYPGGPHISRLAEEARSEKQESEIKLPRPMLNEDNIDFSFSGLKTAVLRILAGSVPVSDTLKKRLAREFEEAVADVLVGKTLRAAERYGAGTVVTGGGVSANLYIRRRLADSLAEAGAKLLVCQPEFATDNAVMIALAGYFHAQKREYANPDILKATGNLRLGNANAS
ncbi:tRNA (adenosine(37)-N6)-threonylcarbamoyltransferase complex transferase subunit TsaD [Candidatus Kaiserbacteria bacterium]|nr:tRNA (adenosine(37)-N6)-threonylcarbamoyltransferase complex transferase subunit TsaD [Candidatus Kaiserbacteria bacterium]